MCHRYGLAVQCSQPTMPFIKESDNQACWNRGFRKLTLFYPRPWGADDAHHITKSPSPPIFRPSYGPGLTVVFLNSPFLIQFFDKGGNLFLQRQTLLSDIIHVFARHLHSAFGTIHILRTHLQGSNKEYKEEAQCAQKGGRMLFFVICGFIENFFLNFYFILQIYHVKSFKMMHVKSNHT